MKITTFIVRNLLGLIFAVFGLNIFFHFIPIPPPPEGPARDFMRALAASHYFHVVGALEFSGGVFLLAGRFVPLGLTLLGPVIVNILCFHVFLDRSGLPIASVVSALGLFLLWHCRENFTGLAKDSLMSRASRGHPVTTQAEPSRTTVPATRLAAFSEGGVELSSGETLATPTLIWTAGVTSPAVLQSLPVKKEGGRIVVNETLEVPGLPGVWAVGDCAWIPTTNTDKPHAPTAQHVLREAVHCAKNVVATMRGSQKRPFRFSTLGQLATIGHRAGVADVFGLRFSGFIAWWLWRTIYLAKLPTLEKKLRVALRWTLDFAFPRDLTQHVTLHGIDRVSRLLAYVRQHPVIARPLE